MTRTADEIRKADPGSYRAWAAQRAAYGLELDDEAFASWWNEIEIKARRMGLASRRGA